MNAIIQGLRAWAQGGTALTALLGAGTASVYWMEAPRGAASPYVIISGMPGNVNENPHTFLNGVVMLKGVATSAYVAGQIADALYARFHDSEPTVTGWTCYKMDREDPFQYVDTREDGLREWHAGANYRIRLFES